MISTRFYGDSPRRGSILIETAAAVSLLAVTCLGLASLFQTVSAKMNQETIFTELMLGPQLGALTSTPIGGQLAGGAARAYYDEMGNFFSARHPTGHYLLLQLGYLSVVDGAVPSGNGPTPGTITGSSSAQVLGSYPAADQWGSGACSANYAQLTAQLQAFTQDKLVLMRQQTGVNVSGPTPPTPTPPPPTPNPIPVVGIKLYESQFMGQTYKRYLPAVPFVFALLCTEVPGPLGGRAVVSTMLLVPRISVQ